MIVININWPKSINLWMNVKTMRNFINRWKKMREKTLIYTRLFDKINDWWMQCEKSKENRINYRIHQQYFRLSKTTSRFYYWYFEIRTIFHGYCCCCWFEFPRVWIFESRRQIQVLYKIISRCIKISIFSVCYKIEMNKYSTVL